MQSPLAPLSRASATDAGGPGRLRVSTGSLTSGPSFDRDFFDIREIGRGGMGKQPPPRLMPPETTPAPTFAAKYVLLHNHPPFHPLDESACVRSRGGACGVRCVCARCACVFARAWSAGLQRFSNAAKAVDVVIPGLKVRPPNPTTQLFDHRLTTV